MKTKKILIITSAIAALMILGCFDTTRDNPFDPGGDNYDPSANSKTNSSNNSNMEFGVDFKEVTYDYAGQGEQAGLAFTAVAYCNGSIVAATADNSFFQSNDGKTFRLRFHQNSNNYNGELEVIQLVPSPSTGGIYILYLNNFDGANKLGFYQLPPDNDSEAEIVYLTPRYYDGAGYSPIYGGAEYHRSIAPNQYGSITAIDNSWPENDAWIFNNREGYDYGWAYLNSGYNNAMKISSNDSDYYYSIAANWTNDYYVAVGSYNYSAGLVEAVNFESESWMGDLITEGVIVDFTDALISVCYYNHLNSFFAVNESATTCVQVTYSNRWSPGVSTSSLPDFLKDPGKAKICAIDEGSFNRVVIAGQMGCVLGMNEDPADDQGWDEVYVFESDMAKVTDVIYANLNNEWGTYGKYIIAVTDSGRIAYSYQP